MECGCGDTMTMVSLIIRMVRTHDRVSLKDSLREVRSTHRSVNIVS